MSQTVRDSMHQKLLEELKQQDRVIMEVEDEEFKLDSPPNELQGSAANRGNNRQTTRHPVDIDEMMKQESLDSDLFNEIARLEDKEEEKGVDEGLMHLTMEQENSMMREIEQELSDDEPAFLKDQIIATPNQNAEAASVQVISETREREESIFRLDNALSQDKTKKHAITLEEEDDDDRAFKFKVTNQGVLDALDKDLDDKGGPKENTTNEPDEDPFQDSSDDIENEVEEEVKQDTDKNAQMEEKVDSDDNLEEKDVMEDEDIFQKFSKGRQARYETRPISEVQVSKVDSRLTRNRQGQIFIGDDHFGDADIFNELNKLEENKETQMKEPEDMLNQIIADEMKEDLLVNIKESKNSGQNPLLDHYRKNSQKPDDAASKNVPGLYERRLEKEQKSNRSNSRHSVIIDEPITQKFSLGQQQRDESNSMKVESNSDSANGDQAKNDSGPRSGAKDGRDSSGSGQNLQKMNKRVGGDLHHKKNFGSSDNRLTLKDLNLMEMPEEESSLDSDEDKDNYLEWLQDEHQRVKKQAIVLTQSDRFSEINKQSFVNKSTQEKSPYLFERRTQAAIDSLDSTNLAQNMKNHLMTRHQQVYKKPNQKDLVDIIEELEFEEEEELQSSQDENEDGDDFDPFNMLSKEDEENQMQEVDEEAQEYYTRMFKGSYYGQRKQKKAAEKEQDWVIKDDAELFEGLESSETKQEEAQQHIKDLMQIIDQNERRYQQKARESIKNSSILQRAYQTSSVQLRTRIVSTFSNLSAVTSKLSKEHQLTSARSTSIGLNQDLVMIGNSEGQLQMFDRETEQYHATFTEKSKEFIGNAVTAIDVHPINPDIVVLGFERGHLVLLDVHNQPNKSLKVVKDNLTKNCPVVNVKFCDWGGPQGKLYGLVGNKLGSKDAAKKEETSAPPGTSSWMFVSIDAEGYVIITSIVKIMIVYKVTRHIAIDPLTSYFHIFSSMSARFTSSLHAQGIYDNLPMVAIGCRDSVLIFEARTNGHKEIYLMNKPEKYYNRDNQTFDPYRPLSVPSISWGYGMSPVLKDRPHSMLAVAWGPLIQLAVLIDDQEYDQPFIQDGFYIVRVLDTEKLPIPAQVSASKDTFDFVAFQQYNKCYIEGVFFLSDSTLIVLLSGQELRVLDTQSFHPEKYDADKLFEKINSQQPSPAKNKRMTISFDGSKQHPEELETGIKCQQLVKPEFGPYTANFPLYQQSIKFFGGKLVVMSEKGVQSCQHLTWQQSILDFQRTHQRASSTLAISEQSAFEEEDLTQVFLRALELFKGRVKGYQGLIDNQYLRENFLRAELKLLVREILQQVIEDAAQQLILVQKKLEAQGVEAVEQKAEEERQRKFKKVVHLAIEFCVELKDCDFLFKDLFWLFQDYGGKDIETIFLRELEVFILAGKFQEWELPVEVIEHYLIMTYLNGDSTASPADLKSSSGFSLPQIFEKVVMNLNLKNCSKETILQFIKYCEKHYLTTGIVFLFTLLFERKDSASCVQVLFSLYDLHKRATEDSKKAVTKIDLESLGKDLNGKTSDLQKYERSKVYLGYKLFWLIRLYLYGKKFPQGNIKEHKWRAFVHDIVQFLSSQEILRDLATLDAETLFQVISVLFLRSSKPYQLVLQGRDDYYLTAGPSSTKVRFQTHMDFLNDMDQCFLKEDNKPMPPAQQKALHQYLFFVANIVAKDRDYSQLVPEKYFFRVLKHLLIHHQHYLIFNKALQDMATGKATKQQQKNQDKEGDDRALLEPIKILRQVSQLQDQKFSLSRTQTDLIMEQQEEAARLAAEELRYVAKTENDILNLVRKCEPLENNEIQELLTLADETSFEQVKLYLLEKKEDYIKCLQMLLKEADKKRQATSSVSTTSGHLSMFANRHSKFITDTSKLPIATQLLLMTEIGAQAERKGDRTIRWLGEKIGLLEARSEESPEIAQQYKALKQEAMHNFKKLLQMSRSETIILIEERFEGNHKECVDLIRREPLEQLLYLETLLEDQQQQIQRAILDYGMGDQNPAKIQQAKQYIDFIKLRLKLCCQLKPERVFGLVEHMVKSGQSSNGNAYYPIEDCLQICEEHNQIEAAFLLNKKLGKYYESVTQGLQILRSKISMSQLKIELYFIKKQKMDWNFPITNSSLSELYFFDSIFRRVSGILIKHGREIEADKEEQVWYLAIDALLDMKQHSQVILKAYCRKFFQLRLNMIVESMTRVVPFAKFLDHALKRYSDTQFKEFEQIILQIVNNQTSEEVVLLNANAAIYKVNNILFESFQQSTKFGVLFRSNICQLCKKYLDKTIQDGSLYSHTMEVDDAELEDELVQQNMLKEDTKVFACTHTFHISCLTRNLKKTQQQQPYMNSADYMDELNQKVGGGTRLKCPTCNIKSFEIEGAGAGAKRNMQKQQVQAKKQAASQGSNNEDSDIFAYKMRQQAKDKLRQSRRMTHQETEQARKVEALLKKMNYFEGNQIDRGLTMTDFGRVGGKGTSQQQQQEQKVANVYPTGPYSSGASRIAVVKKAVIPTARK